MIEIDMELYQSVVDVFGTIKTWHQTDKEQRFSVNFMGGEVFVSSFRTQDGKYFYDIQVFRETPRTRPFGIRIEENGEVIGPNEFH